VVSVLVASVLVVLSISLTRLSPLWWRTIQASDPATIVAAETIENDVVNVVYAVRGEQADVWAVAFRAPAANAWLNTRFAQWLANADAEFEWPEEISDLQVEFDDGLIHIGVLLRADERSQVLSVSLRPEIRADGSLWVRVESAFVGRLPIPAGWIVDRAGEHWPEVLPTRLHELPETAHLLAALAGDGPLHSDPVLDLGDGRRVRLLGLAPERGQLRITCRTEFEE
jgi:hypothetical protein